MAYSVTTRRHEPEVYKTSAKYLLAPKLDKRDVVAIPEGFKVTQCSARRALGATRPVKGSYVSQGIGSKAIAESYYAPKTRRSNIERGTRDQAHNAMGAK